MNVILIFNGLGNQMSQYATYLALKKTGKKIRPLFFINGSCDHYGYELERSFGIKYKPSKINLFLLRLYGHRTAQGIITKIVSYFVDIYKESKVYDVNPSIFSKSKWKINYFWGGWHSEKNFESVKSEVRRLFSFDTLQANGDCICWSNIIKADERSVSMHIRRGDFLKTSSNNFYQFGGVATVEYYQAAINYIRSKAGTVNIYVFSDDIEWCRQTFGNGGFNYITCNTGEYSRFDMYLMSLCKHHINANSTFSWWGAWLTETKETITIVPEYFIRDVITKDIYPDRWIKISSTGVLINK